METVRIFHLKNLSRKTYSLAREGQVESGRVWTFCRDTHKKARDSGEKWPKRDALQKLTKGKFSLHSQSVQMVCHAFLANVDTACKLKKINPRARLPYKDKYFYPLLWPKQAVKWEHGALTLPMGRGRESLRLKVDLESIDFGACKLIWDGNYQLHVTIDTPTPKQEPAPPLCATVDLGQIHLAAVTTETGKSLVVSGRGIRTLKRQRTKAVGKIAKKQIRCAKGSRRWKKLQRAKKKTNSRAKKRVRDLRHKATTQVIDFCRQEKVTHLYVGNPEGVQRKNSGRYHNQRMSQWEFGKDISYLEHKSEKMGIVCSNGSERGTSSHCPQCDLRKKIKGRLWECPQCGLKLHRDVVGSVNMFPLGFGIKVEIPNHITYLRPGELRLFRCSSSLGTGQSSFAKPSKSSRQESCVVQATGPFRGSLQEAHPL